MLFNSFLFLKFFLIFYLLYLLTRNHLKWQNRLLLAASYIFYAAWDWRFLFLLFFTTFLDFIIAQKIFDSQSQRQRKALLALSVVANLGVLGFFKYFNFFTENLSFLMEHLGFHGTFKLLRVALPIGISFYTFQSMSYTIDVYRRELVPPKSFWDFSVFVTYFPHLVAGPILRATYILPQVVNPRKIQREQVYKGCALIFWGLFQKVFVADNLAKIVDPVFNSAGPYDGFLVLTAVYAFAFQILCDFAGYSDIARGLGKLMGFDIVINFNLPYFAANPREFWKRWHISLSTWLRDYLYVPLGGSRKGKAREYFNLFATMLLGGLWHGASWTFVIWGAYHGILLITHRMLEPWLQRIPGPSSAWGRRGWLLIKMIFFFHLVCVGWLFFRAGSISQAWAMMAGLAAIPLSWNWESAFEVLTRLAPYLWLLLLAQIACFAKQKLGGVDFCCFPLRHSERSEESRSLKIEILRQKTPQDDAKNRKYQQNLEVVFDWPIAMRTVFYVFVFYSMVIYGAETGKEFIYFQF